MPSQCCSRLAPSLLECAIRIGEANESRMRIDAVQPLQNVRRCTVLACIDAMVRGINVTASRTSALRRFPSRPLSLRSP